MKLHFQNISYRYPRRKEWVFDSFSWEFQEGMHLLKGYSGCGKSTMLRLAAGLLTPTKGSVSCDSPAQIGSARFLREEVGFVFQQLNLLPLASIQRNVTLAAQLAGRSEKKALLWLEKLGIEDLAKRKPSQLSGGQQQRAALARALAKEPRLLLLDEPTSGLDDDNTQIIISVLTNDIPKDMVCLIATHDSRLFSLTNEFLDFNSGLPTAQLAPPLA